MNSRAHNFITLLTLLIVMALFTRFYEKKAVPSTDPQVQADICRGNLTEIASSVSKYARRHRSQYPKSLSQLVPNYLAQIPVCPAADSDTYSAGYSFGLNAPQNELKKRDYFYVACTGSHHDLPLYGPNLPAFHPHWGVLPELPISGTDEEKATACGVYLKNINSAMLMYSVDNRYFPTKLEQLAPYYLRRPTRCPVTLEDCIVLETGPDSPHNKGKKFDYFYVSCKGNHPGTASFDSVIGLYK